MEITRSSAGTGTSGSMVRQPSPVQNGFWYAFGTHDDYNQWEAPDNLSMAALTAFPPRESRIPET